MLIATATATAVNTQDEIQVSVVGPYCIVEIKVFDDEQTWHRSSDLYRSIPGLLDMACIEPT
jgi:hypothetical protein